ncbi:transposable element Tcb2 transposase [Trichonephila clavipes]|uniref:Transposable element Tcb2 transposase n=1 Tax=Trichonephila clavipes TaxID=2585209 RepID=A0A8X7BBV3_TRICX|nr:transposable element Tcb2 transposase [Trichonephila clavipes]
MFKVVTNCGFALAEAREVPSQGFLHPVYPATNALATRYSTLTKGGETILSTVWWPGEKEQLQHSSCVSEEVTKQYLDLQAGASSKKLATLWSTATGVLMPAESIRQRLQLRGLRARVSLYSIPSRQTIDGCVCNGLLSTEPGKRIGTKLSFQMNHASICGALLAAFVLGTMPVNAAFQSALSNDIVA